MSTHLLVVGLVVVDIVGAFEWPVVDFGALEAPSSRPGELERLQRALLHRGFFYAANVSELDAAYLSEVYALAARAHALPVDTKKQYGRPVGGYSGDDVGVPELAYETKKKSTVRAWDYARERNSFVSASYPPGMEAALAELFDRQATLARVVLRAMAECLGLDPDAFARLADRGDLGTVRLLRYPPVEAPPEDLVGIGAHTDFEAFTLMHQNAPGLQLRAPASVRWEDAPVFPDMFVVIVGDVLERLTNGVLRATPHRVRPTSHERLAIIRFNAFASDTVIEPMPLFVTPDRPRAYSTTTMADIMRITIGNLEAGLGAWDEAADESTTASYDYEKACRQ